MNKLPIYLFTIFTILPLLACQKYQLETNEFDFISYINDFELLQKNTSNNTRLKITGPYAILDPTNNDIEITDSTIEIINSESKDIKITSGKSDLNNYKNLIRVYNNVKISLINKTDSFIITESFDWDLSKSNIDLNNPLLINWDNTTISSSDGLYNIDSGELNINNNIFKRNIFNKEGRKIYQINIIADIASWIKDKNSLEFKSTEKQVETTIYFLNLQ